MALVQSAAPARADNPTREECERLAAAARRLRASSTMTADEALAEMWHAPCMTTAKDDEGSWIRLEMGNDWGKDYWRIPAEKIGLRTWAACNDEVTFGDAVTVRWPTGEVTTERVITQRRNGYADGRWVPHDLPMLAVEIRGVDTMIPPGALEIDRDSLVSSGVRRTAHTPPSTSANSGTA